MRRDVVPWLKVAVCGVVMCGYLSLLATLMYPPVILIPIFIGILGMPLGERLQKTNPAYTQVTTGLAILALFGIFINAPQLGTLNTVIGLMMLVQVHALLHIKSQRHYGYLVLMAFSQVMAASMMSPSPEIGLVYLILVLFTIWSLVLLDIFRGTEEQGEVIVQGTLDYEARNGALRASGDGSFRRNMVGWIGGLAVASIFLAAGLFFLIPRTEAGAFGGRDVFPVREDYTTGLSSGIDLMAAGNIAEDHTALMSVSFPEFPEGRFNGPMYWRVTTFDKFTGNNWAREGLQSRSFVLIRRSARFAAHPEGTRGSEEGVYRADYSVKNVVDYEVFLTNMPEEGVPVLSLPIMVQPQSADPGLWSWDMSGDFTIHHLHRGESGVAYRGASVVSSIPHEELRTTREDFSDLMNARDYTLLTEHNLTPRTIELVRSLTADATNIVDQLMIIQTFLSGPDFRYSLEVPQLPPDQPIDSFIMDVRSGHCQLFASAMALMARSLGIPCRLVSGYLGGTYDAASQSYTVSANMAHVWVEVFLPDFGWTIFDPSPPAETPTGFSLNYFQSAYSTLTLRLKLFWLRQIVGYSVDAQNEVRQSRMERLASDEPFSEVPEARRVSAVTAVADNLQTMLLAFVLLTTLICGALVLRSALRSRNARAGLDQQQVRALVLYKRLQRRLSRLGIAPQGKTAEELGQAAAHIDAGISQTVHAAIASYNDARFGARTLTEHEWAELHRQVKAIRATAAQTTPAG